MDKTKKSPKARPGIIRAAESKPLALLNPRVTDRHAFVRLETVADFHDALLLFLKGVNVSYEPVTGSLSGFTKDMTINTTRRVTDLPLRAPREAETWLMTIQPGSMATIAEAVARMLSQKTRLQSLQIDLTSLPPGDFAERAQTALCGAANLLNWRAGRFLSACDIADLFEWFADLSEASLDGMIAYGAEEWGPFVQRRTTYHLPQQASPIVSSRANRTVMCHVRPELDDLQKLFGMGRSFGLVNGKTYAPIRPDDGVSKGYHEGIPHPFAGLSPNKALRLANHTVVATVAGDLAGAGTIEEAREAAGLIARFGYRQTLRMISEDVAPIWQQQKDLHRPVSIVLENVQPGFSLYGDLIHHADKAAYKLASECKLNFCDRVQVDDPPATISGDHAAEIWKNWPKFIAANFKP